MLAVGDLHMPWHSRKTVSAIMKAIARVEPDIVIQMGDLFDMFSFSRFPRSHNIYTPQQELALARRDAECFWNDVNIAAPKAKRIQLWGNHEERPAKRALEKAPELEQFVTAGLSGMMEFPGVQTLDDAREDIIIEDVCYTHGFRLGPGAHVRANLMNMVTAHTHWGCVIPHKIESETLWELNVGFAANRFAVPMSYGAQRRFSRWTLGYGLILPEAPVFVPLQTEEAP